MTSRKRLTSILEGKPTDRPGVNFYEIGGFSVNPTDTDPFNIYNSPSWRVLLQLAEEQTDLIRMRWPRFEKSSNNSWDEFFSSETYFEEGSRFTRTTLRVGDRTLTSLSRRDAEVNTVWTLEHLLKNVDDLKTYLGLPDEIFAGEPDVSNLVSDDAEIGERGIVMVDTADPLCLAASLFAMDTFTVIAYTEPSLFCQLLDKFARHLYPRTEKVARDFPGHLWRICGPEYATEPYLPPRLFHDYVVPYTGPMVETIQKYGGHARLHCHGRLKNVLPHILAMGPHALDPIEPPPQGDVELTDVRNACGGTVALFGNIEVSDIENMEPSEFEKVVAKALKQGTRAAGRGLVLMPSSAPYGREITTKTMANYETMIRLVKDFR